jgi:hypothetical protein
LCLKDRKIGSAYRLATRRQVSPGFCRGQGNREYQYFRSRWGLAGSTDYRLGEASNISLRGLYSGFHNYGDRWAYTLTDNSPGISVLNPANVGCKTNSSGITGSPCAGAPAFNAQLRNPDIAVGSLELEGTHILTTTMYTWSVSASQSFYGNSPYSTALFSSTLPSSTCEYDPVNTST